MKTKNSYMILNKICALLLVICVLSLVVLTEIGAKALSYEGKGTKKNPYLITTAEQLNGIRENLSAHYKLNATIDMSSYGNFVAIGDPSKPFTGSFTCDTDVNGTPIYAITNLTVHFQGTGCTRAENFSNHKEDGSMGWDIALFGSTYGSTLKNIVLLNADISSNVEGLYSVNSDYSVNPVSGQATASLVANAVDTEIIGCGATGKVVSSSNSVGGLVGYLSNGSIKNSYSYVNVTSTGTWGSGGLLGYADNTVTISSCFYSGTFSGGVTHAGAFVGNLTKDTKISDCWASGTVMTETSGCFGGTDVHGGGTQPEVVSLCNNCYTLSKIEGRTKAQTNKRVINNCYITNEIGGLEIGFAAADMATINSAFKGLDEWTVTDNTFPQLKNVHPVVSVEELGTPSENATVSKTESEAESTNVSESVNASEAQTDEEDAKSTYMLKTNITNVVASLDTNDRVLLFTISGLLIFTLAIAVITVIVVLKDRNKQRLDELEEDFENE